MNIVFKRVNNCNCVLMDVVVKLFVEYGFCEMMMWDIVEVSGMFFGFIYYYYFLKGVFFFVIYEEGVVSFCDWFDEVMMGDEDLWILFMCVVEVYIVFIMVKNDYSCIINCVMLEYLLEYVVMLCLLWDEYDCWFKVLIECFDLFWDMDLDLFRLMIFGVSNWV